MRLMMMGLLVVLGLTGCKVDQRHEVYIEDVISVADTGKPAAADARFEIELLSQQACERDAAKLTQLLKRHLLGVQDIVCEHRQGQLYARALVRAKLPIVRLEGGSATFPPGTVMALAVDRKPVVINVALATSPQLLERLRQDVRTSFMHDIGRGELGVTTFIIVNDRADDVSVTGWPAYVEGVPLVEWERQLQRRGKLEVRLSNVMADVFRRKYAVIAFTVTPPPRR